MATRKRPLTDDELNARKLEAITDRFEPGPDGKPTPSPPSNLVIVDPRTGRPVPPTRS